MLPRREELRVPSQGSSQIIKMRGPMLVLSVGLHCSALMLNLTQDQVGHPSLTLWRRSPSLCQMISPMGCTEWRLPAASVELIWDTCLMTDQDPQENATASTRPRWLSSPKIQPPPSPAPQLRVKLSAQWATGRQSFERMTKQDWRLCMCRKSNNLHTSNS